MKEFGPQRLVEFSPLLHSFMDYFDLAAPLLCARIVDVVDAINNNGVSFLKKNMILPQDITFLKESVGMCLLFVFQYVLKRKKKTYFRMK